MNTERIQLSDTIATAIAKMSDGNPGAIAVLCRLAREGADIDPDAAFGGFANVLALDTEGLYGSDIWRLFKDVCGEDLTKMVAVLRAKQLGYLHGSPLHCTDPEGMLARVRSRLPRFGAATGAAIAKAGAR